MLNYLKKFTMDILPSVAATIIGAYIVNHYIVSKPGADAPVAAAVSSADPKTDAKTATADGKPVEKPVDVSNLPEAGVKAKGMSERTLLERSASEKAVVTEKPQEKAEAKADAKAQDAKSADAKPTDTPAETASIPAEPRRHTPAPREKTAVRVVLPSPVQPATPAVAPVAVTPNPAPPVEAAVAPERDANDLARAAIERLRGNSDNAPRTQQAARTPDAPAPRAPEVAGVPDTPRVVTAPALRPLPPPIMVSTPASPAGDAVDQGSQPRPPYANAGMGDPRRPTPPADIPLTRPPLDLRAEAAEPMAKEHTSVADDMLSAAKSVFHAVLPK
jgi:hypothetical protein